MTGWWQARGWRDASTTALLIDKLIQEHGMTRNGVCVVRESGKHGLVTCCGSQGGKHADGETPASRRAAAAKALNPQPCTPKPQTLNPKP